MPWSSRHLSSFIFIGLVFFGGVTISSAFSVLNGTRATITENNESIAIFYGSARDKQLGELLLERIEKNASYYNISSIQSDSSFVFQNESVVSVWWFNELPLPLDLSFLGDLDLWTQRGRGLFVLNRYFQETPLQALLPFGITNYAPIVIPLDGSSKTHEIDFVDKYVSLLNLNQTTYDFVGSSAWVELDNQTQIIGEISNTSLDPVLNKLQSGIWLADSRVVVGSFSIDINTAVDISSPEFTIQGLDIFVSENFIDTLVQLAQLSIGNLPSGGGILQLAGIEQLVTIGAVIASMIVAFFLLLKVGLFSKFRDIIMGIFTSMVLFIAHVAYSPQRRRIDEDDLLENELRVQILDYLEQKGTRGAHLREIQREVGCGISSLLWHLQALDDFNLVTHEKIGKYHIFYLMGEKSVQASELALALKSDVAKEMCRVLMKKNKPMSLSKISQAIDAHHSSVQHHIKKLSEIGIIIVVKEKKRSRYMIGSSQLSNLRELLEVA